MPNAVQDVEGGVREISNWGEDSSQYTLRRENWLCLVKWKMLVASISTSKYMPWRDCCAFVQIYALQHHKNKIGSNLFSWLGFAYINSCIFRQANAVAIGRKTAIIE